jgi:hypothetical protein
MKVVFLKCSDIGLGCSEGIGDGWVGSPFTAYESRILMIW